MNSTIRNILRVFAVLIFLAGGIWFLQGMNVLPGSYMSGNPQWVINGAIALIVGAGLFWFVNRKKIK